MRDAPQADEVSGRTGRSLPRRRVRGSFAGPGLTARRSRGRRLPRRRVRGILLGPAFVRAIVGDW